MRCPDCGADNDPGRKFCGECGVRLSLACSACGSANAPGVKFCGECGERLAAEGAPSSSQPAAAPSGPESERRLVSVLFADLVGFTTLSEDRDPEEVRELLSSYFDTCRTLIGRYGGIVEKFIGDAVMAVWGTPVAKEDDAERAVRAALELTSAVAGLGERAGAPSLRARAGVLTGEAAVSLAAQGEGMVAGDLVNTASRIQSAADPGAVFVGDATRRASEAAVEYADAGTHALKGKAEPVQLWRAVRVIAGTGGQVRRTGLEAPFTSRDLEFRTVKELYHGSITEHRAHLVSIVGPAGIGKSRIVWEFEKYVDGLVDDMRWHKGRCLAYGEGVTYWALAEMVRTNAAILESEDPQTAVPKLSEAVAKVIGDAQERRWVEARLASLLGFEGTQSYERDDVFAAWRLFYERLADEMPTVMIFEDLQWADEALLDFIEYLMEWSRDHRLFVITLARPELLERRPQWGAGRRSATSIYLEALATSAMADLLTGLVPGLPEEAAQRVLERAEGVPLYAVETVRMLLDRDVLIREDGAYRLTAPVEQLEVPETLHGLIAARLDGLQPEERRLVQVASVLGKTFQKEAIAAVAGIDGDELDAVLAALLRKEIFVVHGDPLSPERGQYVFIGDLVRWVAYETLSKRERKARHLAVAAWLERLAEDDAVEVLASHYLRAYEAQPGAADADEIRVRAVETLARAGDRAASLGANDEARRHLAHAAELAGSDELRAVFLERAGEAAVRAERFEEAREALDTALRIFEELGLVRDAARVSGRLGDPVLTQGRLDEAIRRMEDALEVLASDPHDPDVAELASHLSRSLFFRGDLDKSAEVNELALDIGEALALPGVVSWALNTKGLIAEARGRYQEGSALIVRALEIAVENDLSNHALRAYNNVAESLTDRDRYDDGLDEYRKGLALADRVGDSNWRWALVTEMIFPLTMTGRWDDAIDAVSGLPGSELEGRFHTGLLVSMPVIHIARGDVEAARRIVESFEAYEDSEDIQEAAAYACGRASLLRTESREQDALAAAERAVSGGLTLSRSATAKIGLTQVFACAFQLGDLGTVDRYVAMIDGMNPGAVTPFLRALADRSRARAAAARDDPGGAERVFKASIGLFRETGIPYWRALTQLDYGRWLRLGGRGPEAAPHLDEARTTFADLGATMWLDRLDEASESAAAS